MHSDFFGEFEQRPVTHDIQEILKPESELYAVTNELFYAQLSLALDPNLGYLAAVKVARAAYVTQYQSTAMHVMESRRNLQAAWNLAITERQQRQNAVLQALDERASPFINSRKARQTIYASKTFNEVNPVSNVCLHQSLSAEVFDHDDWRSRPLHDYQITGAVRVLIGRLQIDMSTEHRQLVSAVIPTKNKLALLASHMQLELN